jgi:outer membrane lipoprotein LolB
MLSTEREVTMRGLSSWQIRVWVLIVFALSGCQTSPPRPVLSPQQYSIQAIPNWQAEGKIAINMNGQRQNASFKWEQDQADYVVHLFGPFGQGTTWLRRTSEGVSLENAEIGLKRAATAEQLMKTNLGWQVPVSNLQYWLRGLTAPSPRPKHQETDPRGLLTALEQEGWTVAYPQYQTFQGLLLPAKMTAKRDAITVTIAIKQWQLLPASPLTQ